MFRRKVNGLLFLFSLIGGAAGFAAGEVLLNRQEGSMSNILLMACYFGLLGLLTGLMCLLAEMISPQLNGHGWRLRYASTGWKLLVPAAFIMLLAAGALFQTVYGMGLGGRKPAEDIVLVIDKSSSMNETDPGRESVRAAEELINRMDAGKRAAVVLFNEQPELLQPLTNLTTQAEKDQVNTRLDGYTPNGQTDIARALTLALTQLDSVSSGRKGMVILISDGYSEVQVEQAVQPFRQKGIAIHTVGMNATSKDATHLLKQLADETQGSYHRIDNATEISGVFTKIYELNRGWHLMGERSGTDEGSYYYLTLRILFLALLGALMGLSLGIIFDNRHLAKSFTIGGAVAGMLAGALLEAWMRMGVAPAFGRLLADLTLAAVLALSTLLIPIKEPGSQTGSNSLYRSGKNPSGGLGKVQNGSGSFDRR
ncbi:MAG: VWA domain-containing protein [Gorillibacterium sp.]|nr:VWA domain-containing protein [Gorillibacterium sp.]